MPSSRQLKALGLIAFLTLSILYYATHGERLTHASQFYQKTLAVIEHKKDGLARQDVIEAERQRQERVQRLQKEHEAAMASATSLALASATTLVTTPQTTLEAARQEQQHPVVDNAGVEKSIAGRKKMKDGRVVDAKSAFEGQDGVAKVGNVAPEGAVDGEHSERQRQVDDELNNILKRSPIIIFSKSYCPYSKKAKHILLDNYTITPPPHVVELDQHELGSSLQDALLESTGRRTVPNVLINGRSIGGGDDIEALHNDARIIETIQALGGKRIMSIIASPHTGQRVEV